MGEGSPSPFSTVMKICNVMSGMPPSNIFCDLLSLLGDMGELVSLDSTPAADVYVYWRGHLTPLDSIVHPSVNYIHCDLTDDLPLGLGLGAYPDIMAFDYQLCINDKQVSDLIDVGVPKSNIVCIPHGYHNSLLSINKNPRKDKLRIGFFSIRYDRMVKGELTLYRWAEQDLVGYEDKIEWHLCGYNREVEQLVLSEAGFEVFLHAPWSYNEFIKLYSDIDIFLILSEAEGGPASFPEALASGTLVLGTKVGMLPQCGYGMSIKEIVGTIKDLADNVSLVPDQESIRRNLPVMPWNVQITKYRQFYEVASTE